MLITGAAGRIGSVVVDRLSERWDIAATDMHGTSELSPLDVTDLEACTAAFSGADAVVHLAANPSPDATWPELMGPNVEGAYCVAAAARSAHVSRLVRAAVEAEVTGLVVANGVSANRHLIAEFGDAERLIGYHPRHDAWRSS